MCEIRFAGGRSRPARESGARPVRRDEETGADQRLPAARVTVTAAKSGWWRSTPVHPRARPHGDVRKTREGRGEPRRQVDVIDRKAVRREAGNLAVAENVGAASRRRARPRSPCTGTTPARRQVVLQAERRRGPSRRADGPARRPGASSGRGRARRPGPRARTRRARRPPTRRRRRRPRPRRRRRGGQPRPRATPRCRAIRLTTVPIRRLRASRELPQRSGWLSTRSVVTWRRRSLSTRARLRKSLAPVNGKRLRIRSSASKSSASTSDGTSATTSRCAARG